MSEFKKYANYKDIKDDVAKRIQNKRREKYKTKKKFAMALYGIADEKDKDAISKAYSKLKDRDFGRTPYNIDELCNVCNLLDVDIEYLLCRQDEETRDIKDLKELTGLSDTACKKLINYNEPDSLDKYIRNFNRKNAIHFLSWFMENELLEFVTVISTLIDGWINARNKDKPVDSPSIPAPDSRDIDITDYVSFRFDNEYKELDFETKSKKADEEEGKIKTEKDIFRLRTNDIARELEDCIYRYCKIVIQEREGKQ